MRFMKSAMAIAAIAATMLAMTSIRRRRKARLGKKQHGFLRSRNG
jgi:hypothetical protein